MTCAARTPPRRSCAVFFHQGAPRLGEDGLRTGQGLAKLRAAAAAHLSPPGSSGRHRLQHAHRGRSPHGRAAQAAGRCRRHLTGAKVLAARLYRAGPVTALALTCWLAGEGRFSSSRKAVRFAGLDITVHSSGRKGPPGRLSRQGPPVLRWAAYRGRQDPRPRRRPRPRLLRRGQRPQEQQTRRPAGGPQDRPAGLPHPGRARRRRAHRRLSFTPVPVTMHHDTRAWGMLQPHSPDGDHRGQLPPIRCQPLPALRACTNGQAGGLIRLSGRIPARRGHPINHLVAGAAPKPRGPR